MTTLRQARKKAAKFIAQIDEVELAVRMIEARTGLKRPEGATAAAALAVLDVEEQASWRASARAAMTYWRECVSKMQGAN